MKQALFPGLALCALLAACQQTAQAPAAPPEPQAATFTRPGFKLPEGAGCSGDIQRFRAVQDNDLETGHVNKTVYDKIKSELDEAARLCASGNDGGARSAVRTTKSRYGYP